MSAPSVNLHEEVERGNLDTVRRLLEDKRSGASVDSRDKKQQTPLHIAASGDNLELVRLLLRKDADANVQDRNGWTPLHTAAAAGQFHVCQLLLHVEDIDAAALNKDGTSPLHYLVRRTIPDAQIAVYRELLEKMLERGAELNTQTKHGEGPLHQAALHGNTEAVRFLFRHSANMDILNKIGETPLHYAIRAKKADMVKLLLESGANPLLASSQGGAPLEIAREQGLDEIVTLLENRIADMPKPGEPENLIVRVFQAAALVAREDGTPPIPALTITFGKESRTAAGNVPTRSPQWECEVMFPVHKLSSFGKLRLVIHDKNTKQFLGQIIIPLDSLNLLSGYHRGFFPLKKSRHHPTQRVSGKIEVELGLVDCEASPIGSFDVKPSPSEDRSLTQSAAPKAAAFGTKRGPCTASGCDCEEYQLGAAGGGPCMNCGHYPAQHRNLGKLGLEDSASPVVASSSSPVPPASTASPVPQRMISQSAQLPVKDDKEPQPKGAGRSARGPPPKLGAAPGNASHESSVADIAERFMSAASAVRSQMTQSWEINSTELKFQTRLGEGTSAKVYRGEYRGQAVAIKVLKEKVETKQLAEFEKEFLIMSSLRSPHVVFFFGACTAPALCMVLEFCSNGSVHDVLTKQDFVFDWTMFHRFTSDTMKAINCLHSWKPQIVHRDLKSLNLLVDENWTVKVCDFGLSRFTEGPGNQSTLGKLRGTYAYSAPEVYFGKKYDTKSDVYSIALILWEMTTRLVTGRYQQPYSEYKHLVFDFQIIIQTAKKDLRPTIDPKVPPPLVEIIHRCWKPNPDERPDTPELMDILAKLSQHYAENKAAWDETCHDLLHPKTPAAPPAASSTSLSPASASIAAAPSSPKRKRMTQSQSTSSSSSSSSGKRRSKDK